MDNNLCSFCPNNPKAQKAILDMVNIETREESCKTGCDICMAINAFAVISSGSPLSVSTDRLTQEPQDQLTAKSIH